MNLDHLYDRLRHPAAHRVGPADAAPGDLDHLRSGRYALLVTFRADGSPVPTPVWAAVDEAGRAYVKTEAASGKVRRLGRDRRALVGPSSVRGRPRGPVREATGRVLPPEEWRRAESVLAARYGIGRRIYQRLFPMPEDRAAYLEFSPRPEP